MKRKKKKKYFKTSDKTHEENLRINVHIFFHKVEADVP